MRFCILSLLFLTNLAGQSQYVISTVVGGAASPTPAAANQTSVGDPPRVATDAAGNLYFGGNHCVYKVSASGTLTRVAGTGKSGYSGDGGPAVSAQLEYPDGIVVDAAGNIYVADLNANVVRVVSPAGTISTFAGRGAAGYAGDSGPAAQAEMNAPMGLAIDAAGNIYIADSGNNMVRKVAKNGVITTVAGNGSPGYSGDGGPATAAALNVPEGLAADSTGQVYIADTFNNRVRVIGTDGNIHTAIGTGESSFSRDGAAPATAALFLPTDVATDNTDNLFVADFGNSRIREVSKGIIQTVVGGKGTESIFNEAVATTILLNGPTGVAVDGAGNIYVAEGSIGTGTGLAVGDYRVWKIVSGVVTTAAGNGVESFSGDGGAATAAQLNSPAAMAFDAAGNLYIADAANNRVRRVSPLGTIATVAGNGTAGWSGDGGPGPKAELNAPQGVSTDTDGNVYIADTGNNRIRKLLPDGTLITIAGNGNASFYGDGGPATFASFHNPRGVWALDGSHVYIADTDSQRIRELLPDGTVTTVAGNGAQAFSGDGGPATAAALNTPVSVIGDSAGTLYVADQGNNRVRMIVSNGTISTIAGASTDGLGDGGAATAAALKAPSAVVVDGSGNVYVTDSGHNRIREVSHGTITTLAGTGNCCYGGDGGAAGFAQLNEPRGLLADSSGRLYVADSGNNAVRLIQQTAAGAGPNVTEIANGASNQSGAIAPGEVIVLFGSGLGPAQLAQGGGGAQVLINGAAAQVVYASAGQISAVVPAAISGENAQIEVRYQGVSGASISVPVAAASPALFTANASGTGQVLALDSDGSLNGPNNPAVPGTMVTLYLNGVPQQYLNGGMAVMIGPQQASIVNTNLPSPAPGVTAITVQVPYGTSTVVAASISLQVGSFTSPTGVTLTVGGF